MSADLKLGKPAPAFTAPAFDPFEPANMQKFVSLADYVGRWLIFFWYPLDFTTVCPTEVNAFADHVEDFDMLECSVLGASTDSVHSHRMWAGISREGNGIAGLTYPLLSDQSHEIARDYGVLIESKGIALRGLFIVDPDGVLQYSVLHNLNIGRSVDETIRVLIALQSGGLCGSDWKPGDKLLG